MELNGSIDQKKKRFQENRESDQVIMSKQAYNRHTVGTECWKSINKDTDRLEEVFEQYSDNTRDYPGAQSEN